MTSKTVSTSTLDEKGGDFRTWFRFTLLFLVLCGMVYPVGTTLVANAFFPRQANGSLIERDGVVIGSSLVGQLFVGEQYIIGRPSAAGNAYNPASMSGSNLSVTNPTLRERASATSAEIITRENVSVEQIPVDLIAASGSGIDPHISPEAAALQIPRVATARALSTNQVQELILQSTEDNFLGLGMPGVNVLKLNLSLDALNE